MTEGEQLTFFNFLISKIRGQAKDLGLQTPKALEGYFDAFRFASARDIISSFTADGEVVKAKSADPKILGAIFAARVLLNYKVGLLQGPLKDGLILATDFFEATATMGQAATQLLSAQDKRLTMPIQPFIVLANSPEEAFDFKQFGVPRYPEDEFVTQAVNNALSPYCESASLLEFIRVRGAQLVVPEKAAEILTTLLLKETPELLECFIKAGLLTHIPEPTLKDILIKALLTTQDLGASSSYSFLEMAIQSEHHTAADRERKLTLLTGNFAKLNKPEICEQAIREAKAHADWPKTRGTAVLTPST